MQSATALKLTLTGQVNINHHVQPVLEADVLEAGKMGSVKI